MAKRKGEQIKLAYKKGSLDPLAKLALAKGGKYLITYYQDEIAKLRALVEAGDAELAIQLGEVRKWKERAEEAEGKAAASSKLGRHCLVRLMELGREVGICNDMLDRDHKQLQANEQEMAAKEIDLKAQANEIGFWKAECERYRDQIVALLRGKAYPE